jgi:hypothetical protein
MTRMLIRMMFVIMLILILLFKLFWLVRLLVNLLKFLIRRRMLDWMLKHPRANKIYRLRKLLTLLNQILRFVLLKVMRIILAILL